MDELEFLGRVAALMNTIHEEIKDKKRKPEFYYELVFLLGVLAGKADHAKKQTAG